MPLRKRKVIAEKPWHSYLLNCVNMMMMMMYDGAHLKYFHIHFNLIDFYAVHINLCNELHPATMFAIIPIVRFRIHHIFRSIPLNNYCYSLIFIILCVYIIKTFGIVSIVRWTNPNKNGMLVFNIVGFTFLLLFDMEYSRFDVEPNEIPMLSIWAYLDYYRTFLLAISNLLYLWKPTNRAFIWENRTKSNNFTKSIHWTIAFHQFPVNVLHNSFRHSIQSPSLFDLVLRNSYLFS